MTTCSFLTIEEPNQENYRGNSGKIQRNSVRCPRHTIQFVNHGYTKYIKKALEVLIIVGILLMLHNPVKCLDQLYDEHGQG